MPSSGTPTTRPGDGGAEGGRPPICRGGARRAEEARDRGHGAARPRGGEVPAAPGEDVSGKTSRLDEELGEGDSTTVTKRKTIRVKRPTQRPSVGGGVSVARPTGPGAPKARVPGVDEPEAE